MKINPIHSPRCLSLVLGLCAAALPLQAAKNVLFIAVDDLKPELGVYGEPLQTPAMDAIANNGALFLNAHCQQAVCAPTRASLLTGMRPDYTRVWDLKTEIRDERPDIITLPQHFKQSGYATAGVGKIFDPRSVDNGGDTVSWSLPYAQTWDLDYNAEHGKPAGHYQNAAIKALAAEAQKAGKAGWNELNDFLVEKGAWPAYECEDVPDNAYDDGAIADKGVEYIRQLAGSEKPFFIAVGFKKPHLPFVAPKKYWDLYDRERIQLAAFQKHAEGSPGYAYHNFPEMRSYSGIPAKGPLEPELQRTLIHGYYACVSYIDAQVAKLMAALKEAGVAEDTVIVLWGDHGWHLGDHGLWCKHTNYEQATRVPFIFAGPGVQAGTRSTSPVEFLDTFPTLCELAGVPVPEGLQGVSLVPLLQGGAEPVKPFAVSQFPRSGKMGYALRTGRYRYIAWYKARDGEIPDGSVAPVGEELFDYKVDPLETKSRIGEAEYADVVAQSRAAMTGFLKGQAR